MTKENLQLISVRLDPDTLAKIEKFAASHSYWKRNTIINCLLFTIFKDFNERQIYDMVRRSHFKEQFVRTDYEICDYVKPSEPKQ
ncbi:MAG: hypothetical protein IJ421_04460 [Prevotella sp.]|nr:hypothetical protein [Prevotella sp.]